DEPYYIRSFNGAFLHLLQHVVNEKHQLVFKYDFYDPNIHVKAEDIGAPGSNTHSGDIRYHTFGAGYIYTFNKHFKLLAWYDVVTNERTSLGGYTSDIKDNVLTCRMQFTF